MKNLIELDVNGQIYEIAINNNRTLLEALREDLALTGTKMGCNLGECGTCTVIMDGETVNACTVLAIDAIGKKIETVEGLADGGDLHQLQRSFVNNGAIQCGFCTPGMLMSAKCLLEKKISPDEEDIKRAISGNLCRCTGYTKIIESIKIASDAINQEKF